MLSPILTSRRDERSSGISSNVYLRARISLRANLFRLVPLPSVKNVVDVLEDICEELLGTLKDIVDISSELTHRDHVRIDNIEEVSTIC